MDKHGFKRSSDVANNAGVMSTFAQFLTFLDSMINARRAALDRNELNAVFRKLVSTIQSVITTSLGAQTFTKEWVISLAHTSDTVDPGSYQVSIPTQLNGWQIIGYVINTIAVGASPNSLEIVAADATDAYVTTVDLRPDAAFDATVDEVLFEIPLIVATDDKVTINVTDAGANDTGTTTITLLFNNGTDGNPITGWPV